MKHETVKSLNESGRCGAPGCDIDHTAGGVTLHSRCHPKSPTWAKYQEGILEISCSVCRKVITSFKIAEV